MRAAMFCRVRFVFLLLGVLTISVHTVWAGDVAAPGPFTDAECVFCHTERDPELIGQWQDGPHATDSGIGCSSCHGDRHKDANARARKNLSCIGCHKGPASHSYSTSKHGVINQLSEGRQDWQQPLQRGNYRVPSCSYCHLHNSDHGDTMSSNRGPELRQWVCSGCHSPRYIREQFANGKRQLEIADLKLMEGEELLAAATYSRADVLSILRQSLIRHRKNILYGVGHQSPDYQWWHGHPAMDGDLIRIREAYAESHRYKGLVKQSPTDIHATKNHVRIEDEKRH